MTLAIVLCTCLLLLPWLVVFGRYIIRRPEAIPTPVWMVTASVVLLFVGPLVMNATTSGLEGSGQAASAGRIMYATLAYWIMFTLTYRLMSFGRRTVSPDGPTGMQTAFGTLKAASASVRPAPAFILYAVVLAFQTYLIRGYGLGVSGSGLAMMDLPYGLVVVYMLTRTGLMPFTAIFTTQLFSRSPQWVKLGAVAGLCVNAVLAAMAGRRELLYTLLLASFGLTWSGRRRGALSLVAAGLAAWFVFGVFSPIFLQARNIWHEKNGPGVVEAFRIAIERSMSGDERASAASEENIRARSNSLRFWLDLYDQQGSRTLGGTLLAQAFLMNIPRAISGWAKYAFGATEEYVLGTADIANNVSLISFIDAGTLGPLLYGALFGLILAFTDMLIAAIGLRNRYIAIVASGSMIPFLFSPEADLMGYVSVLRSALIYFAMAAGVSFVIGRFPGVLGIDHRGTPSAGCAPLAMHGPAPTFHLR
jgi:hypothetical protein